MKLVKTLLVGATGLAALTALVPAPAGAEGADVRIRPASLERGPDAGPYVKGRTLIDGDTRIRLGGAHQIYLGRSADGAYVVQYPAAGGRTYRIAKVTTQGREVVLRRGATPGNVTLDERGHTLAVETGRGRGHTDVVVYSLDQPGDVGSHTFPGYADVLAVRGARVAVGGDEIGGRLWNLRTGRVTTFSRTYAYIADLGADRFGAFRGDPYDGGCARVAAISHPHRVLSRSCEERVVAFAPTGRRMATVDILSDGLGPRAVTSRTIRGSRLARYHAGVFFGEVRWEDGRRLLLDTYGANRGAIVRCDGGECERASRMRRSPVS